MSRFETNKIIPCRGIRTDPLVSDPIPADDKFSAVTASAEEDPPGATNCFIEFGGVSVFGFTPSPESKFVRWVLPIVISPKLVAFL